VGKEDLMSMEIDGLQRLAKEVGLSTDGCDDRNALLARILLNCREFSGY
jgi:hypothetical protein